jgi:hypothetical protein
MANHWQLYERQRGWQEASARLDTALELAITKMREDLSVDADPQQTVLEAWTSVEKVMFEEENATFGSADGEAFSHLGRKLSKVLKEYCGANARVSGYGDVEISSGGHKFR